MIYDIRSGESVFKHSYDENPNPKEERFKPHKHENTYELLYFISGDADFKIEDRIYELRSGTMLLVKPQSIHKLIINSSLPYERITIRFSNKEISRHIQKKLESTENIYFVRNTELSNEILRLDVHFSNLDKDYILYAFRNSLQVILSYVVNYKPLEQQAYLNDEMKKITNYIDDHFISLNNLNLLCKELHISKSALCKKFTDNIGIPIMSYIRIKKCIYANALIEKGEKPTKIYKDCGFNDYATFYRAYQHVYHRKPSSAAL